MPERVKRDFLWGGVLEGGWGKDPLFVIHFFVFSFFKKWTLYACCLQSSVLHEVKDCETAKPASLP